jgi:RNA polymerase sigma factor (sigma-70 family)
MQSLTLCHPGAVSGPDLGSLVAAGDAVALSRVYDEHQAALCSFCHRLLGEREAAEDLVHDVFVHLPELIYKLESGRSLRAFLLSIAANRAKHHLRGAARRRKLAERFACEPSASSTQPDQQAEQRWVASRIALALDRLSPLVARASRHLRAGRAGGARRRHHRRNAVHPRGHGTHAAVSRPPQAEEHLE